MSSLDTGVRAFVVFQLGSRLSRPAEKSGLELVNSKSEKNFHQKVGSDFFNQMFQVPQFPHILPAFNTSRSNEKTCSRIPK